MNKKKFLLALLILPLAFIILQPVHSIGLAHGQLNHYFEPNAELKIAFQMMGTKEGTTAMVNFEGELQEYATKTDPDSEGRFYVTLVLPAELSPGAHKVDVIAKEVQLSSSQSMIATLTSVRVPIRIIVPYKGKYLIVNSFSGRDANIGEDVEFTIRVTSWGTETISNAQGKIDVYDTNGEYITSLNTDEHSIDLEQSVNLKSYWDTTSQVRGIYSAKGEVSYDEETLILDEIEFRVGDLLISLLGYTKEIEKGGLKPMSIKIKNEWSGHSSNVYASVLLDDKEFITPPVNLRAFQEDDLVAYINTELFEPGTATGKITLFYSGKKTTIEDISVAIVEPESSQDEASGVEFNTTFVIIIVLVIIIFILILLFFRRGTPKRK